MICEILQIWDTGARPLHGGLITFVVINLCFIKHLQKSQLSLTFCQNKHYCRNERSATHLNKTNPWMECIFWVFFFFRRHHHKASVKLNFGFSQTTEAEMVFRGVGPGWKPQECRSSMDCSRSSSTGFGFRFWSDQMIRSNDLIKIHPSAINKI